MRLIFTEKGDTMRFARFTIVTALFLLPAGLSWTQEEPEFEPKLDERSLQLLRDTCDYLKQAESFTFRADIVHDEIFPNAQKIEYTGRADISVQRPNRLRADYSGEDRESSVWYDGETLTVLDREHNLYASGPAKATIDETLDMVFDKHGFTIPVADLVYSDPCEGLTEHVETLFYVGTRDIDGRAIHHLAATQADIDWQIWIEVGRRIIPRKMVITYADEPGDPQYSATLTDWDFAPRLPERLFQFEAPAGSARIEFLPQQEAEAADGTEEGR
jgi:hypothetical protein